MIGELKYPFEGLYEKIVAMNESLSNGIVECKTCTNKIAVDSAQCLRTGWPKCCGSTMSLMSAEKKRDK